MRKVYSIIAMLFFGISVYGQSVPGALYSKRVFYDDVSVGSWTAISNITSTTTNVTGGAYDSGSYNFTYQISGTNRSGRLPLSTNVTVAFTGSVTENAVKLSWGRYDGLSKVVVRKVTASATNWIALSPSTVSFTDDGSHTWLSTDFTNLYDEISAPTVPWGTGDGNVTGDVSSVDENITVFDGTSGKKLKDSLIGLSQISSNVANIALQLTQINSNVIAIALNRTQIDTNVADIALHLTQINSNVTGIANNASAIAGKMSELADDTSPTLGGHLWANGKQINNALTVGATLQMDSPTYQMTDGGLGLIPQNDNNGTGVGYPGAAVSHVLTYTNIVYSNQWVYGTNIMVSSTNILAQSFNIVSNRWLLTETYGEPGYYVTNFIWMTPAR